MFLTKTGVHDLLSSSHPPYFLSLNQLKLSFPTLGSVYYGYPHNRGLVGGLLELGPATAGANTGWAEVDGDMVRPIHNRLVVFDARRKHRVRPIRNGTRVSKRESPTPDQQRLLKEQVLATEFHA